MTPAGSISALQNKMAASRAGGQATAAPGGRTILRALRLALARVADRDLDLAVTVIGATQARATSDQLVSHLPEDQLLILLDGPLGLTGLLSVDRTALNALIQHQTIGHVIESAPDTRPFTATDAAMVAPLADAMLDQAWTMADLEADRTCLEGFRFGARADDLRSALLVLESDRYRLFQMTLEFAEGISQGRMTLVLPEPMLRGPGPDQAGTAPSDPSLAAMKAHVCVDLNAVICRLRVPLNALLEMKPGHMLPLIRDRLNETDMVSIAGHRVATGRLGQIGGLRAVRVNIVGEDLPMADPQDRTGFSGQVALPAAAGPDDRLHDHPPEAAADANSADNADAAAQKDDALFDGLSPHQAAVEISQLAGLPLPDEPEPEISLPVPD